MIDVFRSLKGFTKIRHLVIDSTVFRMHYNVSVVFLLAFSGIVTTRQYVGNPIDCIHTKDIPEDVLNTYCWIHSTYTIPSAFWKRMGLDVPHPGIDKTVDPDERRYVKYYQWVTFCLFMQVRREFYFHQKCIQQWCLKCCLGTATAFTNIMKLLTVLTTHMMNYHLYLNLRFYSFLLIVYTFLSINILIRALR